MKTRKFWNLERTGFKFSFYNGVGLIYDIIIIIIIITKRRKKIWIVDFKLEIGKKLNSLYFIWRHDLKCLRNITHI